MRDDEMLLVKKYGRESEEKKIRINCFGRLSIYQDGQEMGIEMHSKKARELIAFLMTYHGAAVKKETVCEALWKDKAPHHSLDSLYKLVKKIQKMPISFQLKSNRGMLQLGIENVESDLFQFQELMMKRDCIEDLEQAVNLYKGTLYEEEDFDWISDKEAFYDNRYLEAVIILKKHYQKKEENERVYYYETLLDRYA